MADTKAAVDAATAKGIVGNTFSPCEEERPFRPPLSAHSRHFYAPADDQNVNFSIISSFSPCVLRFCHRRLSDGSQKISHESVAHFIRLGYNKDEPNHEERSRIMSITATELKSNLGKYLLLAATEDIFITRNGKVVAKLSNPHQDRVDIAKSLFGILPADVTLEDTKEERLNRI